MGAVGGAKLRRRAEIEVVAGPDGGRAVLVPVGKNPPGSMIRSPSTSAAGVCGAGVARTSPAVGAMPKPSMSPIRRRADDDASPARNRPCGSGASGAQATSERHATANGSRREERIGVRTVARSPCAPRASAPSGSAERRAPGWGGVTPVARHSPGCYPRLGQGADERRAPTCGRVVRYRRCTLPTSRALKPIPRPGSSGWT